jgi:hypothetical protein
MTSLYGTLGAPRHERLASKALTFKEDCAPQEVSDTESILKRREKAIFSKNFLQFLRYIYMIHIYIVTNGILLLK